MRTKTWERDKHTNHRLTINMHAGTHIDGPMHLSASTTYLNELPAETFVGEGCLLDVRGEAVIGCRDEYEDRIQEGQIVLLYTGHGERFAEADYFSAHPVVGEELAELFVRKRVKMVGMDLPSPDRPPFAVHRLLFRHGILLLENLANLDRLADAKAEAFEVIALPLKIRADSSPARVLARV